MKYTEAILSNSPRKLLWFEISKMLTIQFRHTFVAYGLVCSVATWCAADRQRRERCAIAERRQRRPLSVPRPSTHLRGSPPVPRLPPTHLPGRPPVPRPSTHLRLSTHLRGRPPCRHTCQEAHLFEEAHLYLVCRHTCEEDQVDGER